MGLSAVLGKRRERESDGYPAGTLYWDAAGQGMFDYYTPNQLREVVTTAAGYFQIPAEWIWGQLYRESKRDPRTRWRPD